MAVVFKRGVILLFLSQAVVSVIYAELPDIAAAQLIKAVKSADCLLVNVETRHVVDHRYDKDSPYVRAGRPPKRRLEIHWRNEGTKYYIDVTHHDGRFMRGSRPYRFVMAFNGKVRRQWQPNDKLGYISEGPYRHAYPTPFDLCLTLKRNGKMLGQALEQSRIEILRKESWENHECYYVEAVQPDKGRAKVWIDPKAGWRARCIRYWGPTGTTYYDACATLKDCGNGVWFPVEGVYRLHGNDRATGKRVVWSECRLRVERVKLNQKLTQKDFEIQYPHGTSVHVVGHNAEYIAGVTSLGGFGEEALNRMTGKPLPDLKEYGITADPNQTKDKAILVCFWDMNQRPSRHLITQLAKRASKLSEKGVIVVSVQAAKIDEGKLDEWAKKSNIPFAVGAIATDHEKNRFALGVRSLPWLVLTDKQHVVTDEGFAISDLGQAVRLITNTEESKL